MDRSPSNLTSSVSHSVSLTSNAGDGCVEYILRVLQVKKIPFTSYDVASDEDAKKLWKRKAPLRKYQS